MSTTVEQSPHALSHPDNPNHDPALTDGVVGAQSLADAGRASASPPPDDEADHDLEMDIDTRKHMEAPRNHEGKMICIRPGCETMRFDRKCEWSKHMDKHDRPYKCPDPACVKLKGFTYSGGLLRHQREVHKRHGGPKEDLMCPVPFCKRNNGPGFTRRENLNEHMRRVHRSVPEEVKEQAPPKRRERRSLRRKNEGGGVDGVAGQARREAGPVDTALMDVGADGQHAAPQANMGEAQDEHGGDAKQLHPYAQAEAMSIHHSQPMDQQPAMTPEQAQHLAQQQHHSEQVHHPAVPADFQVAPTGVMEAQQYELAYLRQEVDRIRREADEKDQKIAQLEAALLRAGAQQSEGQATA